jgi:eukaryotic-like serine/threonine-protein kinase
MKLGRYELLAELARGGMGIVWLAEARGPSGFAKACVVKELHADLASDARHRAMFLDEARLAAQLNHRNIVQTHDLGSDDGRLYMVLELLEGASLRRVITLLGRTRVSPALAARIVVEILSGLDYAHRLKDEEGRSLGVVHRDLSPSNVFLTFDGQVKLLDFGIARHSTQRDKTREGFVKGTTAYMSPDHVVARPIDPRADVFAAGILLREMLLGERLWGEASEAFIVRRLSAGDVPEFPSRADVPEELRAVCRRAMAAEREHRFSSAADMRDALEEWLAANDRGGSLADVARLFETDFAYEVVRHRLLLRQRRRETPTGEEPPVEVPVEVASETLVTDPNVRVPARPRERDGRRSITTKSASRFALVMAIVATIAASVSVASTVLDDDGAKEAVVEPSP